MIDDTGLFNEKLREYEDIKNFNRPRGGLGGQTPNERLKEKVTNRMSSVSVSCTMVGRTGLEPVTPSMSRKCATRLRQPPVGY